MYSMETAGGVDVQRTAISTLQPRWSSSPQMHEVCLTKGS